MQVIGTELEGVRKLTLDVFEDYRGTYVETFNEDNHEFLKTKWIQDDVSVSKKNVLRGIHGDLETSKLITCLYGEIYLVIVDCRQGKEFGNWESFLITGRNGIQIYVPPERGVAHLVLSDYAVFNYKQSTYYNRSKQFTYRFDDPKFSIWWPVNNPILSERDARRT